jgi:hypothetical protein
MNLPADLLALAEEALAKKFDLPEIVSEKPKPKVKKASAPKPHGLSDDGGERLAPRETGWSRGEYIITISVQSREHRVSPRNMMMDMGMSPMEEIRLEQMSTVTEELVWFHQSVMIPSHASFGEKEYRLDRGLRDLIERVQRQTRGPRGDMTMSCDGYTYPINCRQDISRFIERELR